MEALILILIIAFVVWIVWRVREKNRAVTEAALARAWQIVLSDPQYEERRRYEEERHKLAAKGGKEP